MCVHANQNISHESWAGSSHWDLDPLWQVGADMTNAILHVGPYCTKESDEVADIASHARSCAMAIHKHELRMLHDATPIAASPATGSR